VTITAYETQAETARLAALLAYGILDTPPEQAFDDLVELAAAVCGTTVAAVAFIDTDRAWLKAKRGVDVEAFPRDVALSSEALNHDDVFAVRDVLAEAEYHSSQVATFGLRFFAGAPLISPEGHALGVVCVLDPTPRDLSATQAGALRAIARQVMNQLELRRVSQSESLARHRYRALVEQLPGGVYIEDLGTSSASYISPQIERLTGYSAEEWSSEEDFFASVLHPGDRARVLKSFSRAHQKHGLIQIEYRLIAKDGRVVWIQDDAAVARDTDGGPIYLQGYMADVTARKESDLRLREIQTRYQALAEQLPFITYVDDPAGGAAYVSPQVQELVGYSPEAWLAATDRFTAFVHPDDAAWSASVVGSAKEKSLPYELEYRMISKDGREVWMRDTAVPIREGGSVRWQGYIVDITERRAIAEERDRLLEGERAQNERLRSLDRMKDEFVALVSHELRTPLTSIRGYLELVLDDAEDMPSEQRGFLQIVDRNADRLLHLVSDLLLVAQAEAGKLTFDWVDVELGPLVTQCVLAAQPAAEQGGIELVLESEPGGPIVGDPARIAQLLDNLVSNAIKFSPSGGRVAVRVERVAGSVVIEVEDSGIGISPEDQEQLFDRFFRTRQASDLAIPGTGLGLSIAKAIVVAHGGSIGVESAEGRGTTFRVELPAEK
jgi:PAS domain S-box-containing protein